MNKAVNCDTCVFFKNDECSKGHTPRFLKEDRDDIWSYRYCRRCLDHLMKIPNSFGKSSIKV